MTTIIIALAIAASIALQLLLIPLAAAAAATTTNQITAKAATIIDNNTTTLGKPFLIEQVKPTGEKEVMLNGTQAIMITFAGKGTINDMNFTQPEGKGLVIPISKEISKFQGEGIIVLDKPAGGAGTTITTTGSISFKVYEVDHANPNGTMNGSGAVFFGSNGTGILKPFNNAVGIFKDVEGKDETSLIKVWNWPAK
jgi:hypothetical protein